MENTEKLTKMNVRELAAVAQRLDRMERKQDAHHEEQMGAHEVHDDNITTMMMRWATYMYFTAMNGKAVAVNRSMSLTLLR